MHEQPDGITLLQEGLGAARAEHRCADASQHRRAVQEFPKPGYLGQSRWQLPPTHPDPSCTMREGGYNCIGSPMGGLYYNHLIKALGLKPGEPVVRAPDIALGPFHSIQPYLYWSCAGTVGQTACSGAPAAPGFEWSFSFGNGFQGTDVIGNMLYVMVYARDIASR